VNNIGKPNIEVGNSNELIFEADPTLYIRKLALIPEKEALKEIEKIKADRNLKNKFVDAIKAIGIETLKQAFPPFSIVLAGIEELIK
jgi:putative ribosome biogenesis GTPase RsgA